MRKVLLLTAALVAAVAVLTVVTLPPRRTALQYAPDGTIPGILHVHTSRSDGRSSPDEIAAAAARAGLSFVVFTDHGDGTRVPDPPAYRSGVLCLEGVEISTTGGHYLAIDMTPSPYPLGGEPRDVIEDVRRLGGFGIVAHPDSPKSALRWREWTAPFDALEWLNPDTSWRAYSLAPGWRPRFALAEALFHYPIRPAETISRLLGDPGELLRWEALTQRRRVVALAGSDAHAKLALRNTDPGDNRFTLPLPGYEETFRALSVHVATERPLTRNAGRDAAMLVRALRAGHAYTAIDGFATPPSLSFTATNELGTVHEGDELGTAGPVTLEVRSNAPAGYTTVLFSDANVVVESDQNTLSVHAPADPAVYRVEIRTPAHTGSGPKRWIVSNPIYVRPPQPSAKLPPRAPATESRPIFDGQNAAGWRVERAGGADGEVSSAPAAATGELRLRYVLGTGAPSGQVVALVCDVPDGLAAADRLALTLHADHPMRVSVQLRVPGSSGTPGQRWQRSVYVGTFDQEHVLFFDDMTPVGETTTWKPPLKDVRSIIVAVDTTNSKPGSSGQLSIKSAALQR